MRRRVLLLCLLGGFALACASGPSRYVGVPFEGRDYNRYPGPVRPGEPEYILNTGDELELTVRNHEEFNGKLKVDKQGKIRLPLILDYIHAEGLTTRETEEEIKQVIKPYLVGDPAVRLNLVNPDSHFVWIFGEVRKTGRFPIRDERLYLRELILRAGSPTEDAALNRTKLVRSYPDRRAAETIHLKRVLYNGDLTQNYELRPGDVVYVPPTYLAQITFALRKIVEPFRLLASWDQSIYDISRSPRSLRDRDTDSWQYDDRYR